MTTIEHHMDITLNNWFSQISCCVFYDKWDLISDMWPVITQKLKEKKLKVMWSNSSNPNHKQTVLQCTVCTEATWIKYSHKDVQKQIEDMARFLKVAIKPVQGV